MFFLLSLLACNGTETCDTCDTSSGETYSLVADQLGDGVLFSAWSDGATLRMVGGELGGGGGVIAELNGDSLCTETGVTEAPLWWIHGPSEGEWYAVGEVGTILHSVDGTRTREDVPTTATLFGTYHDGTDVWAVGGHVNEQKGEIWRKKAGEWTLFAGDLDGIVFKVWNTWFVGEKTSYQIVNDELVEHPTNERLLTIRGRSTEDVWAVGGAASAKVMHFEAGEWVPIDASILGQPVNGVWTDVDEPVWVTGNFGTIAHRVGDEWIRAAQPITNQHFHAVWPHQGEMYFVGGNLFTIGGNFGTIGKYGAPLESPLSPTVCSR